MTETIGQIFGAVAVVLGFISFQMKTQKQLLAIQTLTAIVFCIHYALLGANVGMILNAIVIVRNIAYYIRQKKGSRDPWTPIIFAVVFAVAGICVWDGWFSVFSVLGLVINTVCMSFSEPQNVRKSILVTSPMVLLYNCFVFSIGGVVYESVAIISSIIGIIRHRKKRAEG